MKTVFYVNEQDHNHRGRVFTVSIEDGPGRVPMEDYRDATEYMYLNKAAKSKLHGWAWQTQTNPLIHAAISVARS